MFYKRRGLSQHSASKAKLVKLKLSTGKKKHQTAEIKKTRETPNTSGHKECL
jgi:hypothetical protein